MRKYKRSLVEQIRENCQKGESYGTEVEIMPIPDSAAPGTADPRVLSWAAKLMDNGPDAIPHSMDLTERRINVKTVEVKVGDRQVRIQTCMPEGKPDSGKRPACIFLHGGSWTFGSPEVLENAMCLLAEKGDCVVCNVDYALAPEYRFPVALDEVWGVVQHVYEYADQYGVDPGKIAVGGDSAGGNLAAAIALKDRDDKTGMIRLQLLAYPVVTAVNTGIRGFEWSLDEYEMAPEQRMLLEPGLILGRPMEKDKEVLQQALRQYVRSEEDFMLPYVSPMLAESFEGVCPALIATAEFDGLRLQGEYYGKLLREDGCRVKLIRYRGMGHAFLDNLGYYPQTEALVEEMAEAVRNL